MLALLIVLVAVIVVELALIWRALRRPAVSIVNWKIGPKEDRARALALGSLRGKAHVAGSDGNA